MELVGMSIFERIEYVFLNVYLLFVLIIFLKYLEYGGVNSI